MLLGRRPWRCLVLRELEYKGSRGAFFQASHTHNKSQSLRTGKFWEHTPPSHSHTLVNWEGRGDGVKGRGFVSFTKIPVKTLS